MPLLILSTQLENSHSLNFKPFSRYYPGICLEDVKKTMKIPSYIEWLVSLLRFEPSTSTMYFIRSMLYNS
jgi:hypothetical protein